MKILIIEPEQSIAVTLKSQLQTKNAVDVAHSGNYGLILAESNDYDVIVIEQYLPDMTETEVCQQLRQDQIFTPILMLTHNHTSASKISILDAGADNYLVRPYIYNEFEAKIRALIRRSPHQYISRQINCGPLSLNTGSQAVFWEKTPIYLRKKELGILEVLIINQGIIISRQTIQNKVWQENELTSSNTIDVHINTLRKKIDHRFKVSLIKTIYGQGYKLVNPAHSGTQSADKAGLL